jgi:hypothetical protein
MLNIPAILREMLNALGNGAFVIRAAGVWFLVLAACGGFRAALLDASADLVDVLLAVPEMLAAAAIAVNTVSASPGDSAVASTFWLRH